MQPTQACTQMLAVVATANDGCCVYFWTANFSSVGPKTQQKKNKQTKRHESGKEPKTTHGPAPRATPPPHLSGRDTHSQKNKKNKNESARHHFVRGRTLFCFVLFCYACVGFCSFCKRQPTLQQIPLQNVGLGAAKHLATKPTQKASTRSEIQSAIIEQRS